LNAIPAAVADDDAAEGGTSGVGRTDDGDDERPNKRQKLNNKRGRGKERGANKGRRYTKTPREEIQLCFAVAKGDPCGRGDKYDHDITHVLMRELIMIARCKYAHDIQAFLDAKPEDLIFPATDRLSHEPPFVLPTDPPGVCPVFAEQGICSFGWKCRFLASHLRTSEDGKPELIRDEKKAAEVKESVTERNFVLFELFKRLHSRKVRVTMPVARPGLHAHP